MAEDAAMVEPTGGEAMPDTPDAAAAADGEAKTDGARSAPQIDQGAYQVLRNRLNATGQELQQRLDRLNAARREEFGTIETALIATDRITTPHNCVPRDMVAIGERILFGYNVHFGLKHEIELADVLTCHRFAGNTFEPQPLDLIDDDRFRKEFKDLYRYYKDTTFSKFFVKGPHLYMKFRVGKDAGDVKAFKWAIDAAAGRLTYLDNRSDHEVRYPPQHGFDWKHVTRDMLRTGSHPHYSIEDKLFVETVGGTLTLKVEDNTDVGHGILDEPVDDPDQGPDDADIAYAVQGHLVMLRIRPYQEDAYRYFVFNSKLSEAVRLDAIAGSCLLLPDDHGLIFSSGYYLASGKRQLFSNVPPNMIFERRIAAPNGEDHLYIFYDRDAGIYALLSYNVIEQQVETPIVCSGFATFDDGRMIYFRAHEDPQKHHAIQIWQTPYVGPDFQVEHKSDSRLFKIGNRDIVRGMAECAALLRLLEREDLYSELYVDIAEAASDLLDAYYWLGEETCFNLAEVVAQIRSTAQAAIGEFDKVTRLQRATADQVAAMERDTKELISASATRIYDSIAPFVKSLSELRGLRGRIIALRELKYADPQRIDALEQQVEEQTETLSRRTVEFLLHDESLAPYEKAAREHAGKIEGLTKATDARERARKIDENAAELEMLIDIVSNLKIDDATQRTTIIDNISAIFSKLNAARASLKNRLRALGREEGLAEFNSQLKLLNQSVVNYLDLCDTPEKTDQFLTKIMVQVEELEGRFAEFDEFVLQLAEKRDEVYNVFESRKLQLVEKRNKRAQALAQAAERILGGIRTRIGHIESVNEIHGYFASDLMIDKVRDIIGELGALGDSVKIDDIQSQLKTIREDAVRQLKDRHDLQGDGENTIRFGKHVFSVNTQPIDLTTLLRDGQMQLHLTGTRFFEKITDEAFEQTRPAWDQEVVSEDRDVYRAEYLAYLMMPELLKAAEDERRALLEPDGEALRERVRQFMGPRYSEGYTKGVHDEDAAKILRELLDLSGVIGLLRYPSHARALAAMWWQTFNDAPRKAVIQAQLSGFGQVTALFPEAVRQVRYIGELSGLIRTFAEQHGLFDPDVADAAGEYLFFELTDPADGFAVSPESAELCEAFEAHLRANRALAKFRKAVDELSDHPMKRYALVRDWISAFVDGSKLERSRLAAYVDESAAWLFAGPVNATRIIPVNVRRTITGLVGGHPNVEDGVMELDYNAFFSRLDRFAHQRVPMFEQFTQLKRRIVHEAREEMRLDEFKPRVLTSFVRNRLLDRVYLPLVGDNLAKQMGTAGEQTRTDRMGMLLVISPPGYGKTTLMEYIANRLGIVFMKINGPALGHSVRSLDPAEAPNAAAREEIEKLNLAFEMGDNVMIYVDDIQHTHSEFLQKFISLCDAQRRVEGVYKGRSRTYDLRGRKVAVVMAGNPYTESGQRFQIPDMLANRADTYNLGDIIGEHDEAFKTSYLENCLTSNPALSELAARSQKDVYSIIKIAQTGSREGVNFEANFTTDQIEEMVAVMKKLMAVRDVILRVNQEYIRSAGIENQYRTEPAFLLQGSYRNMNRIAERVLPVMNDEELRMLILSSYEQDAQTLTSGAESNLLKFKEMMGWLSESEAARWEEIKRTFRRNNDVAALGGDRAAAVVAQLAKFNDGLGAIGSAIADAASSNGHERKLVAAFDERTLASMQALLERLEKMPDPRNSRDGETEPAAAPPVPATPPPSPEQITGRPSPYEIRVTNKIPDSFLIIMKEQFKLMRDWLEPLTRITANQEDRIAGMSESLDRLIARYDVIIDKLEDSRENE